MYSVVTVARRIQICVDKNDGFQKFVAAIDTAHPNHIYSTDSASTNPLKNVALASVTSPYCGDRRTDRTVL